VSEGDSLTSTITVESTHPLTGGGGLAWLRVDVAARDSADAAPRPVLLWRCTVILA
jgi:hypothetical protein